MPYPLPTRDDLRTTSKANLEARIPGASPALRRGVLPVIADEIASVNYLELRYLNWQIKQLFPDTAEGAYLARFAALFNIKREAATPSAGDAIFAGTAGTVDIPLYTLLQSQDGSVQYQTQADASVVAGGTVDVPILALTAGSAGNADAGTSLPLVAAIAGVAGTATVDGNGLTGGTDIESDASLLVRTLARIQNPPQGGAETDYTAWVKLVPGVTRAWVYPSRRGIGTVDTAFVMDGRTNIIPLSGDMTAAQASINLYRPVTADAQALAPIADITNITIANLTIATGTTTATAQGAVQTALAALFATTTPGGAAIGDGIDAADPPGVLALDQITAAIASAPGVKRFDLVAPAADIASASLHIATLGTVSFE